MAATKNNTATLAPQVVKKSILQIRRDIEDWKWSKHLALAPIEPKVYFLQDVFNDIAGDALLTSQLNNRREQTISAPFELVTQDGKPDDKITGIIQDIPIVTDVLGHIWDSEWYGCSVIDFSVKNGFKNVELVNRRNIVAATGRFYPDTSLGNYIEYRNVSEFGNWILEFDSGGIGLLDKVVPHILFNPTCRLIPPKKPNSAQNVV